MTNTQQNCDILRAVLSNNDLLGHSLSCVLFVYYGSDFVFLWYVCVYVPAFAHPTVCVSHSFPFVSVFFLFLFSVCFLFFKFWFVCLLPVYFLKKERKKKDMEFGG